jgi:diaminohydroxyphosphoribosylaminopyrimidine deaminase/5-amino-6-(5-phosphoribosylamino)uracil reductase
MIGFTAGVMIGAEGQPALGALGLARLADAQRFAMTELRAIGPDILHRWMPAP